MVQPPRSSPNLQATLRFLGVMLALVLIFGACSSLFLGAFDKSQTNSPGNLFNPGVLFGNVTHFFQQTFQIIVEGKKASNGEPYWHVYLDGLLTTIEFCFLSLPLALLFGFILALMSRSRLLILRVPARAFVEFFRNTPLLVQMLVIYKVVPLPLWILSPFTAGIATLALNYAAYECENIRAGLGALDKGQGEAAASLGLGYFQSLRHVLIPQTISIVLPPVLNDLIYLFKDSSILSLITIIELTAATQGLVRRTPSLGWEFYLIGAALYLILSLPLSRLARSVEQRLKSLTFVPKGDLTVTALQVLVGGAMIGLLCGVFVEGFSGATILAQLSQYLTAMLLVLTIMLFTMIVLGAIVYIPASLIQLWRRRSLPRGVSSGPQSSIVVAK